LSPVTRSPSIGDTRALGRVHDTITSSITRCQAIRGLVDSRDSLKVIQQGCIEDVGDKVKHAAPMDLSARDDHAHAQSCASVWHHCVNLIDRGAVVAGKHGVAGTICSHVAVDSLRCKGGDTDLVPSCHSRNGRVLCSDVTAAVASKGGVDKRVAL
jgi:hypothetical protein